MLTSLPLSLPPCPHVASVQLLLVFPKLPHSRNYVLHTLSLNSEEAIKSSTACAAYLLWGLRP
jgi:hypothetical protein